MCIYHYIHFLFFIKMVKEGHLSNFEKCDKMWDPNRSLPFTQVIDNANIKAKGAKEQKK